MWVTRKKASYLYFYSNKRGGFIWIQYIRVLLVNPAYVDYPAEMRLKSPVECRRMYSVKPNPKSIAYTKLLNTRYTCTLLIIELHRRVIWDEVCVVHTVSYSPCKTSIVYKTLESPYSHYRQVSIENEISWLGTFYEYKIEIFASAHSHNFTR